MRPLLEDHLRVPEPDVLLGKVTFKVLVDPHPHALGAGDDPEHCRFAVPDMDGVGKHVEDRKVVLDDHDGAGGSEFAYQFCRRDPLVNIQKWRDLIKKIEVRVPCKAGGNRDPLEFPARERPDLVGEEGIKFEGGREVGEFIPLIGLFQQVTDGPGEYFRDVIDILRLGRDPDALFCNGLEVVKELGACIAFQDLFPRSLGIKIAKVRAHLPRNDLDGSTLPDPVCPEYAGHLPLYRDREAIECKPVLPVPVRRVLQLLGKAHDIDRFKRALLDADPAPDTELFGDERLAVLADDHGLVAGPDPGAVDNALGAALLCMTPVFMDDSNAHGGSKRSREVSTGLAGQRR